MNATTSQYPLFWIPLLPILGAAINLIFGRRLKRSTIHAVACTSIGLAALFTLYTVFVELGPMWWAARTNLETGGPQPIIVDNVFTWISSGTLKIDLSLSLDTLTAVMIVTVTFVGFLIHLYSTGYMSHDPRPHAYFGYLNLFTGAMLILVLGDSLPVMFIGWEGVGVCSYLLIGFWFDKEKNANAGRKAFVANRIGDFAFLLGIFLLFMHFDTVSYAGLQAAGERLGTTTWMGQPVALWAGLLLFIGACGKSAQIPLYVWLPDAMAGPTPVSALIHAATMVTAGVYMVVRLGFMYLQAPEIMLVISLVGTATALLAAAIGFAQTDIKKVLAYSTVSQLGFMFAAAGCGAFTPAIFHLFTHAFFKAGLFLGAGSVMHAMGDRTEIMEMGGLKNRIPTTHWTFKIYCLAIAGIPLFSGFFSKDEILAGAYGAHFEGMAHIWGKIVWLGLSVAALGTAFYMWRLYYLVFSGESRADAETQSHIHESPWVMTLPLAVLAVATCIIGFLGMPHHLGLPSFLRSWLDGTFRFWPAGSPPEAHVSTAQTLGLMAVATGFGVLGILIARYFYKDGPERVRGLVAGIAPLHKLAANKFYVDELYELIILRPFRWIATFVYNVFDRLVIDLILVQGSATVADIFGRLLRLLQNGDVQRYFAFMVVGLVVPFLFWDNCNAKNSSFAYSGDAAQMTFSATVGEGPVTDGSEVKWDFTGDGVPDRTGREVGWSFGKPGTYRVTMEVQNQVYPNKTIKVTHPVTVTGGSVGTVVPEGSAPPAQAPAGGQP